MGLKVCFWTVVIAFLCFAACRGCLVSEKTAYSAVEKMGFTDIKVVYHAWVFVFLRGCSKSDAAKFTVEAVNPIGKQVTIEVCSGWLFKGATIRSD